MRSPPRRKHKEIVAFVWPDFELTFGHVLHTIECMETKKMKRIIAIGMLGLLSACGDSRTSATLRSVEEIRAVTDTFTVGTTTLSETYTTLGPWNRVERSDSSGSVVVYWVSGGGEVWVNFQLSCDAGVPNCLTDGDPATNQRDHFVDISVHED